MSALALILANRGYSVSGSDQRISNSLQTLIANGITIFKNQSALNISSVCKNQIQSPLIIISTAIPSTNPELRAAKSAKLKILHRSDVLAHLIDNQPSIVISGTHGKTTTSTIITTLLAKNNQDPTAIIGGLIPYYKSNANSGKGKLLVAEADESDGTIVKFNATLGLITNLELDHINHYTNIKYLIKTMKTFGENSNKLLANYDCGSLRKNFKNSIWWSTKRIKGVDFAAIPSLLTGKKTIANFYEKGKFIGEIVISLPGLHNLSNVTGAIAACRLIGISFKKLQQYTNALEAPLRRFEFRGIWNGRQVVDDYAHHPTEIKATLSMVKLMINSKESILPNIPKRIVSIFQPHRFSRTKHFLKEFSTSLSISDLIILPPIYDAGEIPINGVNSEAIAKCIKTINPNVPIVLCNDFDELIEVIQNHTKSGDLIVNMGAGNINNLWQKLKNIDAEQNDYYEYRKVA